MISIIIPLYNKEKYIARAIQSILNQSYQKFEIIVVDDGSKDMGGEIVSSFSDSRIKLIRQKNSGVSIARNRGVTEAKYPYVAFLDADDFWKSNHLEVIYDLIKTYQKEAKIFSTNFIRLFPDGEELINRNDLKKGIIDNYFKISFYSCIIHTSCICIEKDAFLHVGGFDSRFSMGEDIHLWKRLARLYKVAYSPKATSFYTIGAENNSGQNVNYQKDAAQVALNVKFQNKYDFVSSLIQYIKYIIKSRIKYKPSVKKRRM